MFIAMFLAMATIQPASLMPIPVPPDCHDDACKKKWVCDQWGYCPKFAPGAPEMLIYKLD
jgi:hypothetical protein